ncbi:MAG: hypothetical protein IKO41_09035 [Lachnospiraceae bacterium]|nr:hypothetical protein [Lachnospiraceae bacterium]
MLIKLENGSVYTVDATKMTIEGPGLNGRAPYSALVRTLVGSPLIVVLEGQSNFCSLGGSSHIASVLR